MARTRTDWLDELTTRAPDVVAAYRGIEAGRVATVRTAVRRRTADGSAGELVQQLAAVADALSGIVAVLPYAAFEQLHRIAAGLVAPVGPAGAAESV